MRRLTTVDELEAIVGSPLLPVLMKSVDALDDGCRSILAHSPIAAFAFRDREGVPHTTLVGGVPGFVRVDSPTRVSIELPADQPGPVSGGGVSSVILLPGIGETLRLNGSVAERSGTTVVVDLSEVFVHCAKCTLRSGLWEDVRSAPGAPRVASSLHPDGGAGPLADTSVADFLASSPFVFLSSWDARGASDTSPKGDRPGFMRILDSQTLAIPDRKGNQRTDTFHNLLACDQLSIAALVPGRADVLCVSGTASVTDDPALLSTMALKDGEKLLKAALLVQVERAAIVANEAVPTMWKQAAHVARSSVPDLMRLAAQHLTHNKTRGAAAWVTRALVKGLTATPTRLLRQAINLGYRKELEDEGY